MSPIRLGFIGLSTQGWAAFAHAPPLAHELVKPYYTVTALSTRSEASANAAAAHYSELFASPVKGYYGHDGAKQLVEDPNVDMVAISVNMPDHKAALDVFWPSGKKLLFVEWTPGKNYAETLEILEKAKSAGVRVLVGEQGLQSPALRTIREVIESGKIGEVLSTSALVSFPLELGFSTPTTDQRNTYGLDINNGADLVTVATGHFLFMLTDLLGDITSVTAAGQIQIHESQLVDSNGALLGKTLPKTTYDQVSLAGVIKPKKTSYAKQGIFVNVHGRSPLPTDKGRRSFQWIIDGTKGSIEVVSDEVPNPMRGFIPNVDPKVFVNGEEVALDKVEEDVLPNTGKAWLEFAKQGRYTELEESARVHRVLDAVFTSIKEGRRVDLA